MIIKPYSAVRDDAFAAANFPACKMFLKFDEGAGTAITDSVSGYSIQSGLTVNWATVENAARITGSASPALGRTITIGTKSALLFAVANLSTVCFVNLGTAGSTRIGISSTSCTVSDGTNIAATTAPTTGSTFGHAVAFVPGTSNEATKYQASTTVWTAPVSASGSPGDITGIGDVSSFVTSGAVVGNLDIYGLALFVFDSGIPADVKAAIAWMTAEWQRGNKAIYPGWKGLA